MMPAKPLILIFLFFILPSCQALLPKVDISKLAGKLAENKTKTENLLLIYNESCGKNDGYAKVLLLYNNVQAKQNEVITNLVADLMTNFLDFKPEKIKEKYSGLGASLDEVSSQYINYIENAVQNNCRSTNLVRSDINVSFDIGELAIQVYDDLLGMQIREELIQELELYRLKPYSTLVPTGVTITY
ncbi:MAG: hypothetical protein H6558_00260 [Lewinellaceae bacterium]|nr:hypothetical protein [Lewinellaceae bacterium]